MPRWIGVVLTILLASGCWASPAAAQALRWHAFERALAMADSSGRPVLVDVYAPWCGWCQKMKREVYPSEAVRACLDSNFVLTRLNRDDTETVHSYRGRQLSSLRLAQALRATAVPTVVVLAPDGRYLLHLTGFVEADGLRLVLAYIVSGAYHHSSFEVFRKAGATGSC